MFIQCYVFLINCGLSLVCIYASGRFLLEFSLVRSTVSSSDAQYEIWLTKLVPALLRLGSCSCSSSHQQQCESQQQTCKTLSPMLVAAFSARIILCLRTISSALQWSPGSRSRHQGRITPGFSSQSCREAAHANGGKSRENHTGRTSKFSCQNCFFGVAGHREMRRSNWWGSCLHSRKWDYFLLTMLYWRIVSCSFLGEDLGEIPFSVWYIELSSLQMKSSPSLCHCTLNSPRCFFVHWLHSVELMNGLCPRAIS